MIRLPLMIVVGLLLNVPQCFAQTLEPTGPDAVFNGLALRSDALKSREGVEAAIAFLEDALLSRTDLDGRINLRLGQLYRELGKNPEAASHYQTCDDDDRVDAMDRELVCQHGFRATTAKLIIEGLPSNGQVLVISPELFTGRFTSGERLPRGPIELVVEVPGRTPQTSELLLEGRTIWHAVLGALPAPVSVDEVYEVDPVPPPVVAPPSKGTGRWPAYVALGLGAALVGTGVGLGVDNQNTLDDIRSRQATGACGAGRCLEELGDSERRANLADRLWIGGAVLSAGAGLLFILLDDEESAP